VAGSARVCLRHTAFELRLNAGPRLKKWLGKCPCLPAAHGVRAALERGPSSGKVAGKVAGSACVCLRHTVFELRSNAGPRLEKWLGKWLVVPAFDCGSKSVSRRRTRAFVTKCGVNGVHECLR